MRAIRSNIFDFRIPAMFNILYKINWVLLLLMLYACAPSVTRAPVTPPSPPDAQQSLFEQSEKRFQSGDLDQALAGYSRYLGQFPQGRFAGQACGRIGAIYMRKGELDAARSFYQRLIADFPDSPMRNEARLALIDLQVLGHQSKAAMETARQMLAEPLDEQTRRGLWQRLEQFYNMGGDLSDATAFAYLLYVSSSDSERPRWAERLKANISRLGAEDLARLWQRMDDPVARSYLMYRHATLQVVNDHYGKALELLIAFARAYPAHEYIEDCRLMIADLEKRLSFIPGTLGCLLPLSGPYQLYGQRALNGIEMALSLHQQNGPGAPIKLVIRDTGTQETQAVQGVRELVQAGCGAIIGPIVASPAAAREAQKLNIPMVTLTQKSDITAAGEYIFRHFITPQSQVQGLVGYFINELGRRRFAILYPKEAYGETFMNLFWDEVVHQGGNIVGVESYDAQQTDFSVDIKNLIAADYPALNALQSRGPSGMTAGSDAAGAYGGPVSDLEEMINPPAGGVNPLQAREDDLDGASGQPMERSRESGDDEARIKFEVLFIPDAPKTIDLILPQLTDHDARDLYLAGTNLWHSPQLLQRVGDYSQRTVVVDGFAKESLSSAVRQFVEMYRSIYQSEPDSIEAFAFDTTRVLLGILTRPELRMRQHLRDLLLQVDLQEGVTGPLAFTEKGEAVKSVSILRVEENQFVEVQRR